MRFQTRDGEILQAIYDYDGVLAPRHLKEMFWPDKSLRAMLKRLSGLINQGYLVRPTLVQRRTNPIPEAIYWLGWRGALWIADHHGIFVSQPKNEGENQMRKLHHALRKRGLHWVREPRWGKLAHDLAVIDFRLALERSASQVPSLGIESWVLESEFRSSLDTVEFDLDKGDGILSRKKRGVCPDSFCIVVDAKRRQRGEPYRLPLLLEIDMGTHPVHHRFGPQKAAPYAAYLKSEAYKSRFGLASGAWLVITGGERRMEHLMQQTRTTLGLGANSFFFTRFSELSVNLLTAPIWWQAGKSAPQSLLNG